MRLHERVLWDGQELEIIDIYGDDVYLKEID